MADRKIYCSDKDCGIYLGEIRDATLRKNIHHLCDKCETKRLALKMRFQTPPNTDTKKSSGLGDIFDAFNLKL
jgi:hypothetical protein